MVLQQLRRMLQSHTKTNRIMAIDIKDLLKEVGLELSEARFADDSGADAICKACLRRIQGLIRDALRE